MKFKTLVLIEVTTLVFAALIVIGYFDPAHGAFEELLQYGVDLTNVSVDENGKVQGMNINYTNAKSAAGDSGNVTAILFLLQK